MFSNKTECKKAFGHRPLRSHCVSLAVLSKLLVRVHRTAILRSILPLNCGLLRGVNSNSRFAKPLAVRKAFRALFRYSFRFESL